MTSTRNIAFLVLTAGLGIGAFLFARGPLLRGDGTESEEIPTVISTPISIGPDRSGEPVEVLTTEAELTAIDLNPRASAGAVDPGEAALSTVIWPLVVEVALAIDGRVEVPEGAQSIRWGANAGIKGTVRGNSGRPVPAKLEFLFGPNEGRSIQSDAWGRFGANNLLPGISVVRVTSGNSLTVVREVRLMGRTEREFHVNFANPSFVSGIVKDERGVVVEGAEVHLDGKLKFTNADGEFTFSNVPAGSVNVTVNKDGFARCSQKVGVGYRQTVLPKNFIIFLEKGGELQISVNRTVGSVEPSVAYLMPAAGPGRSGDGRGFPWHEINPIEIPPGGSAVVQGLPLGSVNVRLFHRGAVASPASKNVRVHGGRSNAVAIDLLPAPTVRGVVMDGGKPASGALVQIEAADRAHATSRSMQQKGPRFALETVVSSVPSAYNETKADGKGQFTFTSPADLIATYYATATSSDGKRRGIGVVPPGAREVRIELEPISKKVGAIEIDLPGRFQGLPVEVRIQGAPSEPYMLRSGEPLQIEGLGLGTWYVQARWRGTDVVQRLAVVVDEASKKEPVIVKGSLPPPAIQGQTAAERDRALAAEEILSGSYKALPR